VMSRRVPIPTPTETRTRECRYGFYAGVGAGEPIFTYGLPVTGPTSKTAVVPLKSTLLGSRIKR
jgi:hypothetical protein